VPDIIVSADRTGGPRVQVYRGTDRVKIADFFGIDDPNFRGGARVAVGDVNGDGVGDLIVAAGFGGGPRIATFDGKSVAADNPVKLFGDYFAFEPTLRNGVFIAAGDVDGDGYAEEIAGGGPGGGPRVTGFSGKQLPAGSLTPVFNFFAGNPNDRGGVRVAVKNVDGDTKADLVTGAGDNSGDTINLYRGVDLLVNPTPSPYRQLDPFAGTNDVLNGVYVG
jgi:hypothetical protein